jgi:putative Ca2+/H+ antiporter (TMEM165/GDT1 family)
MDIKIMMTVFITVFLAELGDKTQLATMIFAGDKKISKLSVFIAASLALTATSALGVFAGTIISKYISEKQLTIAAGIAFILIGVWTLIKHKFS